jgi:hypothetical protein
MISLPCLILTLAFFNGRIDGVDETQAVLVFLLSYFWHLYIFRKRENYTELMFATVYDKIKDRIFSFFLPIFLVLIAVAIKKFDVLDQAQALLVFIVYYFWHKYLIRKSV